LVYNLHLSPRSEKFLQKIKDKKIKEKLLNLIEKLKLNPLLGLKLKGKLQSYYRARCSNYRIVYNFNTEENTLLVLKIDDRKQAYK